MVRQGECWELSAAPWAPSAAVLVLLVFCWDPGKRNRDHGLHLWQICLESKSPLSEIKFSPSVLGNMHLCLKTAVLKWEMPALLLLLVYVQRFISRHAKLHFCPVSSVNFRNVSTNLTAKSLSLLGYIKPNEVLSSPSQLTNKSDCGIKVLRNKNLVLCLGLQAESSSVAHMHSNCLCNVVGSKGCIFILEVCWQREWRADKANSDNSLFVMLLPQPSLLCLCLVLPPWSDKDSIIKILLCRISVFMGHRGVIGRRQGMICDLDQNGRLCQELFWMHSLHVQLFFYSSFFFSFPGEEGTQTHTESSSQEAEGQTRCQSCTSTFLKLIWRFLIILSVSSSWVGTTQFVKITFETFDCPFFITWFSTNWNIMIFPIYYSGHLASAQEKQSPIKKFR